MIETITVAPTLFIGLGVGLLIVGLIMAWINVKRGER